MEFLLPFERGWWGIYLSLTPPVTASPLAALRAQLPSYLSWPGRAFTALLLLIHLCLLSITLGAGWDPTCHPLLSHTFRFHLPFHMEYLHLTTLPASSLFLEQGARVLESCFHWFIRWIWGSAQIHWSHNLWEELCTQLSSKPTAKGKLYWKSYWEGHLPACVFHSWSHRWR